MTPIKEIWVFGETVVALDTADKTHLICHAVDEQTAQLIGLQLSMYHGRDAYAFKPSFRRMVPLGAEAPAPGQ